jgi:hypothetical protein
VADEFRVRFEGRPDLSSESFSNYRGPVKLGEKFEYDGQLWQIDRVEPGDAVHPDTIVFVPAT